MTPLRIAIAADHAGAPLVEVATAAVSAAGAEPLVLRLPDAGPRDDYPDVARLVADALGTGQAQRGVLLCGSGAGVSVAANKFGGVRAALAHDTYSSHQMVEHDDVNVLTMGARVVGTDLASEIISTFAKARFSGAPRHARRLEKVLTLDSERARNGAVELHRAGQSLWLDTISRHLLTSGTLARYIADDAVTGLTSNPTILAHAMSAGHDYDELIRGHLRDGVTDPQELVYACALDDLRAAADLLRPVWDATEGVDGWVSLEVPPELADDTAGTIEAARRLHQRAQLPNLFVKVPGTSAGVPAIEELIAAGVPINVTLLFSDEQYRAVAQAYLRGLGRRVHDGQPPDVASVASLFVSRWDRAADPLLPPELHGRIGVAVMRLALAAHRELLASPGWTELAAAGARPQRLLWASTSTKDPELPDTFYVGQLASPGTINTMPEKTLLAVADHGQLHGMLQPDTEAARAVLSMAATHGVDATALARNLQAKGAHAFAADWAHLLDTLREKSQALASSG
jgi:transaldolase